MLELWYSIHTVKDSKDKLRHNLWTKEELTEVVKSSYSVTEALRKLNYSETHTLYMIHVKNDLEQFFIDTSHFAKRTKTYKSIKEQIDDGEQLKPGSHTKNALINYGYLKYECSACGISDWQGNPLSLHLDHIDGNRKNNHFDNFRLLCPNCHSQTDTYCRNNARTEKKSVKWFCIDCGKKRDVKKVPGSKGRCKTCKKERELKLPDEIELFNLIQNNMTFTEIAEKYSVSQPTIKRWIKIYESLSKKNNPSVKKEKKFGICEYCSSLTISPKHKFCSEYCCQFSSRKVKNRPTKSELRNLIELYPWTAIGKMYGVSDNAVRKWAKGYGLPTNRQKRNKNP